MECKMCILIVLLIQTIAGSAQSVLSGRIIDKESIPMTSATILLLSLADSAYVTGTTSDSDGQFEISNLESGDYILSFSMIGFAKILLS